MENRVAKKSPVAQKSQETFVHIVLQVVAKINRTDLAGLQDPQEEGVTLEALLGADNQTLTVREVPGPLPGIAEQDWTHPLL